jgi:hypothetical protein
MDITGRGSRCVSLHDALPANGTEYGMETEVLLLFVIQHSRMARFSAEGGFNECDCAARMSIMGQGGGRTRRGGSESMEFSGSEATEEEQVWAELGTVSITRVWGSGRGQVQIAKQASIIGTNNVCIRDEPGWQAGGVHTGGGGVSSSGIHDYICVRMLGGAGESRVDELDTLVVAGSV